MKKVLIVEDDEPIQTFLYDILSTSGFHPITAKNGIEAINYLEKETPDIVILDCEMPKMDGYETLKYIRSTPRTINLPVIFLTVRGEHKDQVKGIELGADDYIVKPFNKDILIAKIKTLLKHREIATSVNPLTKLPGNTVIEQEIKKRLNNNQYFVFFYIDLANFKAYNDYYGFHKGDEVIKFVADILVKVTGKYSPNSSFVGHIGGDDFVVILDDVEKYKLLADQIIQTFDEKIINFYQAKDVEQGYILVQNRQGQLQRFPIMTISVTSISTKFTSINHYGELINKAAELKKYAKGFNRSILAEERRAT